MIEVDALSRVEVPLRPIALRASDDELDAAQAAWRAAGLSVFLISGTAVSSAADLFIEFQRVFEFPDYFGQNWAAFDECITDLDWLDVGMGIVVVLTEPAEVLSKAGGDELSRFIRKLASAALEWSQPVAVGEAWDRPPVPFHVVLAGDDPEVEAAKMRWVAAGASIANWTP